MCAKFGVCSYGTRYLYVNYLSSVDKASVTVIALLPRACNNTGTDPALNGSRNRMWEYKKHLRLRFQQVQGSSPARRRIFRLLCVATVYVVSGGVVLASGEKSLLHIYICTESPLFSFFFKAEDESDPFPDKPPCKTFFFFSPRFLPSVLRVWPVCGNMDMFALFHFAETHHYNTHTNT